MTDAGRSRRLVIFFPSSSSHPRLRLPPRLPSGQRRSTPNNTGYVGQNSAQSWSNILSGTKGLAAMIQMWYNEVPVVGIKENQAFCKMSTCNKKNHHIALWNWVQN